jgi:hypothetical protein
VRRALGAFAGAQLLLGLAVWGWARMPSAPPLDDGERAQIMAQLRAALDHVNVAPPPSSSSLPARALRGPLLATLYVDGAPAAHADSRAPTLAAAAADAAAQLARAAVPDDARRRGRLAVDVVLARAPLYAAFEPLLALSLVPGLDGIGVTLDRREAFLGVDDLMRADALAAHDPLPGLDLQLGADTAAIRTRLAATLAVDPATLRRAAWFRFRADRFVEPADPARHGQALPVLRGVTTPGPAPTPDALRAGAIAGGRYLLRHLYDDGRFGYEYLPALDQDAAFGLDYSLPRHAGATYYLAQLYGATHDRTFADGAARALAFLSGRHAGQCDHRQRACVASDELGRADLGATAIALLAAVEYQAATGDTRFAPWMRRLAAFVLYMQKPSGDFCHLYDPLADRRDEKTKLLYFSGEAAFALAKLTALVGPGDPDYARWTAALDSALHYLMVTQYAHLAGQFYFGEDHWTCMAADAGWEAVAPAHRDTYADFCDDFAAFLRRTQFRPEDAIVVAQPDFAGAYGFTPFLPPHATPVGSRSEAVISTYHMQQRRGRPDPATREQIRLGMQFLLAHQIRDDDAWLMQSPEAARGGFLMSDVKRYVRIDFVQHSCSAMLRAIPTL